jgi:thiol:disulfide interchange protein DsbA
MKKLLIFVLLLANSSFLQAADFVEGKHYKRLVPQQSTSSGEQIEILEFFWYGCSHCYTFEPYLNAWKKNKPANVKFVRIPTVFRAEWEAHARTYYALSNMGVIEDLHGKIFSAIHTNKKRLNTLSSLANFVEKHGVNRKQFMEEANSFSVDSMVRKAKKKQAAYKIQGVPSIAVNGKYLTGGSMAGSYDNLIKIMNQLIEKESKK